MVGDPGSPAARLGCPARSARRRPAGWSRARAGRRSGPPPPGCPSGSRGRRCRARSPGRGPSAGHPRWSGRRPWELLSAHGLAGLSRAPRHRWASAEYTRRAGAESVCLPVAAAADSPVRPRTGAPRGRARPPLGQALEGRTAPFAGMRVEGIRWGHGRRRHDDEEADRRTRVPQPRTQGKDRGHSDQAVPDAAGSVPGLHPGRGGAVPRDREEPGPGLRVHRAREPRRGDHATAPPCWGWETSAHWPASR